MKKLIVFGAFLPLLCTAQTATDYYNQGLAEFAYGNIALAIEKMNKAIELKPDFTDALSNRGYYYNISKEYDKAISDYLVSDKLKKNTNGYLVACPYAQKGNTEEAFKWLEASLKATENKAVISTITNDPDLNSLHSDPKWDEIINKDWYSDYEKLMNEGNEKAAARDLSGAQEAWDKAIALEPENDQAYNSRGINYIYQGDLDKALEDITEAIRLNPENSTYYGNRAYIYNSLQKDNEAMNDYNKAIELDPTNMVYADRAMLKYIMNQKDASVVTDLLKHLDCYYKDDLNWYLLGTYYSGINNMSEAIKCLSKAIDLNDTKADYYSKRGFAYFAEKQTASALADYNKAISLSPEDGRLYYERGTVKGEKLDKDGACADWKKAQQLGFADPNGYIRDICD